VEIVAWVVLVVGGFGALGLVTLPIYVLLAKRNGVTLGIRPEAGILLLERVAGVALAGRVLGWW
jgi:hypothetical protein